MTIEHPGVDELGAEAMPGGLAEIQRAMQPASAAGAPMQSPLERRDSDRSGYSGRRKRPAGPPD
jgi:hypothetical protein